MCEFARDHGKCPVKFEDMELMCPLKYPLEDPVKMMNQSAYSDGFFNVSPAHGFMPTKRPLIRLPERYKELQELMDAVPYHCRKDSVTNKYVDEPGLLATPNAIEEAVKKLPNFLEQVSQETDTFVIAALYRNYVFLTSSYLLEPSNHHFVRTGDYGVARQVLPANIAQPLCKVSEILDVYPWLDYHYAYSLGNWVVRDDNKPFTWDNMDMATCFSGRRDEHGFIMVHADINQHSPGLIGSIHETLSGMDGRSMPTVASGLKNAFVAMTKLNARRKTMWTASNPTRYNDFRVFIMGSHSNPKIFGEGVVYEGVSDEKRQYRGESGAQDDVVPTMDCFTGVVDFYPVNDLTKYLIDLRTYRPKVIQRFLNDLRKRCTNMVSQVAHMTANWMTGSDLKDSLDSLVWLASCIDQIHEFRHGHWMFVQRYIMANTKYEMASGGTPITTWIPNNIQSTLDGLSAVMKSIEMLRKEHDLEVLMSPECLEKYNTLLKKLPVKLDVLAKQKEALAGDDYDAKAVYDMNGELKETDV